MTRLSLLLPAAAPGASDADPLAWLIAGMQTGRPPFRHDRLSMAPSDGDAIVLKIGEADGAGAQLVVRPRRMESEGPAAVVPIVPGLALAPPQPDALIAFLAGHMHAIDHVGITLSCRDLDAAEWAGFIAQAAAALPAWRLAIGSNDIVMIVAEGRDGERAAVIELVHDQTAPFSSMHLCLAVTCDRKALEARFPMPLGGAKPGDEPFFRTVALPPALAIPAYLDLAFGDGGLTPWPEIVRAMGRRIG